ncbi:MAG: dihydrofolate reductase family protein [Nitrospinae bacterium]|nr:dihydrofolate reductase family protein [Nitrospinota bacterium]
MEKPFVYANLAMTLDGKIASYDREDFSLGSGADRLEMDRLRAGADVVIWGGETLRTARHPARVREESLVRERVENGLPPHPANAVITKSGDFPKKLPWFASDEVERFVFTAPEGARRIKETHTGGAQVLVLDEADSLAGQVLAHLGERGMRNVLLEGGGSLIWEFARHIDEFHVTLTPWLAGGSEAPTLMDGPGFRSGEFLGLDLVEVRREGDELFLRYAKKPE